MKIYLAGPMRGIPEYNFPAFDAAAEVLRDPSWEHEVFNPADRDREEGLDVTDMTGNEDLAGDYHFSLRDALHADLAWITANAEAVVVLDGWQRSSGARAEAMTASALGLPVYIFDDWWSCKNGRTFQGATPLNVVEEIAGTVELGIVRSITAQTDGETIITDPVTGGQKGQKECQLGAIDPTALMELGRVAGYGSTKYARFNYLKGYAWSLSADAMLRHMLAFLGGEDLDPETNLCHMAHAAWHGLALTSFWWAGLGTDDRSSNDS